MTQETTLALEWWRASGLRTLERLAGLVDHWLDARGVTDPAQRRHTHDEAVRCVRPGECV